MNFPKHDCGLYLQHNQYKDYYETIEWAVEQVDETEWAYPDEKDKCLSTGSIWTLQWYPNTPISSITIAASTVEKIFERLNELGRVG